MAMRRNMRQAVCQLDYHLEPLLRRMRRLPNGHRDHEAVWVWAGLLPILMRSRQHGCSNSNNTMKLETLKMAACSTLRHIHSSNNRRLEIVVPQSHQL